MVECTGYTGHTSKEIDGKAAAPHEEEFVQLQFTDSRLSLADDVRASIFGGKPPVFSSADAGIACSPSTQSSSPSCQHTPDRRRCSENTPQVMLITCPLAFFQARARVRQRGREK